MKKGERFFFVLEGIVEVFYEVRIGLFECLYCGGGIDKDKCLSCGAPKMPLQDTAMGPVLLVNEIEFKPGGVVLRFCSDRSGGEVRQRIAFVPTARASQLEIVKVWRPV